MKSVKFIIKQRMRELDWLPYDLAKAVKGKVLPQTIYNFLKRKSNLNSETLGHVLEALGLEIRTKEK